MNELHIIIEFENLEGLESHLKSVYEGVLRRKEDLFNLHSSGVLFEVSDFQGNHEVSVNLDKDL